MNKVQYTYICKELEYCVLLNLHNVRIHLVNGSPEYPGRQEQTGL